LASQRITIAKLAGASADGALHRLGNWTAARLVDDPSLWSSEQWPDQVRLEVDDFAEQLRAHGLTLPVVYFTEWSDLWSMGDLFQRWLMPPGGPPPTRVHGNQFEVFAYGLPDGGRLADYLAAKEPQQWAESNWYIGRLREAVEAWQDLVQRAALVVLRYVVDASTADEQVEASLHATPDWLRKC
jgi:hypothetical protein